MRNEDLQIVKSSNIKVVDDSQIKHLCRKKFSCVPAEAKEYDNITYF